MFPRFGGCHLFPSFSRLSLRPDCTAVYLCVAGAAVVGAGSTPGCWFQGSAARIPAGAGMAGRPRKGQNRPKTPRRSGERGKEVGKEVGPENAGNIDKKTLLSLLSPGVAREQVFWPVFPPVMHATTPSPPPGKNQTKRRSVTTADGGWEWRERKQPSRRRALRYTARGVDRPGTLRLQ